MRTKIASVLTGGALTAGLLMAGAAPAQAKSYVVFEAGRAKISAGMIECKQFVMQRDGAKIQNFQVQPRIEKYVRTETVRYRDRDGSIKTKKVEHWAAVGGTNNPARENRQFGGRNSNARVSTGTFQKPSDPWTYRRHVEGHGKYRCVGFVTALVEIPATDFAGRPVEVLEKKGPVKMDGPIVNTSHR